MKKTRYSSKKKRNIVIYILLAFLLFFGSIVCYSIHQYRKGVMEASKEEVKSQDKIIVDDFQGADPEFGEINILLIGTHSRGEKHSRF
ncbi:hypothetical protein [Bacillus sp. MRMR6]|uniref:hypothetical protein n=1 Tax=Bacillus sp. MRMR6 TaxID=1928617 RepID=UPI0020CA0112|nr:hypothetical protein [Bacillus sp. MRMR6]